MVIGVGLIILAPFMVFLLPNFIANSLYFRAGSWFVFTQKGVYGFYAMAFILLIAACFVLYAMSLVRKSWYIGGALIVLSAVCFYMGGLHYVMLTDDGFDYRPLFSSKAESYKWGDVDEAVFRSVPSKDGDSTLTFTFSDGKDLKMKVDRLVFKFMQPIENRLSYEDVEVEKILVPPKD